VGEFVVPSRRHLISPAATSALFVGALLAIVTIRTEHVPAQTGAGPSQGSGLITGRVVEADSKTPIAAAIVALSGGGGGPFAQDANRVLTDAEGRFFVSDVAAGSYSLTAQKPGYVQGAYGRRRPGGTSLSLDLADAGRQGDVTIVLWRDAIVTGRVVDESGEPMVNVAVRAARMEFVAGHRQMEHMIKIRTDDRGIYRFSSLLPGDYVLAVVATVTTESTSYAGAMRENGEPPSSFLQTMTAVGSAPLISYQPVTGVTGSSARVASSELATASAPPQTGTWLTYPTTYLPSATTLSSATVVHALPGQVQSLADLTVRLMPTYQVSGQVMAPEGPAGYYAVHLIPLDAADAPLFDAATAVTDAGGVFNFFGVSPGPYVARVVKTPFPTGGRLGVASMGGDSDSWISTMGRGTPGVPSEPLLWASQSVTVSDRNIEGLNLTLSVGPRVTGRVQFQGAAAQPSSAALAAMSVSLEPANGLSYRSVYPGRLTPDGQFATPSTWPSRYLVRASAPPGWTLASATYQGVDVSETPLDLTTDVEGVLLLFTDQTGTITGAVEPDPGGTAVGAAVLLFPSDSAAWVDYGRSSRRVREVPVGPKGTFTLPTPPAGDYDLVAIPDEQAADWQNPAFLSRVSAIADHISVTPGQSITHALHVRRVQ
jgi:hypothetical protein